MHGLQKFLLFSLLTCLGEIRQGSTIIHGRKAPENSMLYMVSVQNAMGHICGGFLITADFVVTAAQCDGPSPTHVLLGNHNLKEGKHEKINIEKTFKHESFVNVGHGDDIMLLKLSTKAQLGWNVQIIQLPCPEIKLVENEECQVAGWGQMEEGILSDDLRVMDMSVINHESCKKQFSDLPANVICARGFNTEKGSCQGDGGGPLVCKGVAVGIVSFNYHEKCNSPHKPNVYTDISKYREWIDNILTTTTTSTTSRNVFCGIKI